MSPFKIRLQRIRCAQFIDESLQHECQVVMDLNRIVNPFLISGSFDECRNKLDGSWHDLRLCAKF